MTINFGLKEEVLEEIRNTVSKYDRRAKIFGSRAIGNERRYSDIDIAVYGDTNASDLHDELDELDIIYTCDVVNYDKLKHEGLKKHIDEYGKSLF